MKRLLDPDSLRALARGCAVLGAGGGGGPYLGLPVADADAMGRAFPGVPQVTMHLAGLSPSPAVMTDERGNLVIFQTVSGHWMQRLERAAAVEFGGSASSTEFSMTAAQARGATVRDSVSLAIRIGEAVSRAQESPVGALIAE